METHALSMFSPEKDFNRKLIECLGKDGKSISALAKDLEAMGIKHHRLILTGYLRAMTDLNYLKEREVPPSKIYVPIRSLPDNIYQSVGKSCRKISSDPDETILFVLNKLFKRPIFDSELRMAGTTRTVGEVADQQIVNDCRRLLRREGNVVPGETAFLPIIDKEEEYAAVLSDMILESKDSRHLVMETKQTKLI